MTEALFRDNAYLDAAEARVVALTDTGGIVLDRTIFYPTGGGQPGDRGHIELSGGRRIAIANTVYADAGKLTIAHLAVEGEAPPAIGETVKLAIDWPLRYARMRMHTAMHLLSVVLPYAVTGGSVGETESRLDFDIPDPNLDKDAIERQLNSLIRGDHAVSTEWISDAELDANPGLVKTMSVAPPRGQGRIRLIRIGSGETSIDLQPCGGTHVRSTAEIGAVEVTKIEKKGKLNRRVRLAFAGDAPEG
ncbi:MAG: alanyl-tRNA editing protein [Ancalomicrobiaceae bacterium]|nr:alanyl-tRNA editing protein [Ancalomicrobiaceae bacterium]